MVAGNRRADVEILLRVSRMYYEQGLTQSEIAERVGYSRPHVSRLLTHAREWGIVRISISHPLERILAIEADLRRRLPIESIRVAEVPESDTMGAIGRAAAELLADTLLDGQVLAVGNGRSISAVARHLQPLTRVNCTVVQLLGSDPGGFRSGGGTLRPCAAGSRRSSGRRCRACPCP